LVRRINISKLPTGKNSFYGFFHTITKYTKFILVFIYIKIRFLLFTKLRSEIKQTIKRENIKYDLLM